MINVINELSSYFVKNGEDIDSTVLNRPLIKMASLIDTGGLTDQSVFTGINITSVNLDANVQINDFVYMNETTKLWEKASIVNPATAIYVQIAGDDIIAFSGTVEYKGAIKGKKYYLDATTPGLIQDIFYEGAAYVATAIDTDRIKLILSNEDKLNGLTSSQFIRSDSDTSINGNIELIKSLYSKDIGAIDIDKINSNIYNNTSVETGYIKIKLPTTWNSTTIKFDLEIYDNVGESKTITIGGRNDTPDNIWSNVFATQKGSSKTFYNIHFGDDGDTNCIYIGDINTVWDNVVITPKNFIGASVYALDIWLNKWYISVVSILGTISSTVKSNLVSTLSLDTELFAGEPITNFIRTGSVNQPISIGLSATGLESYFQKKSTALHEGQAYLNASWIYTNAIEAQGERDSLSTGIAIGMDNVFNTTPDNITLYTNGLERIRTNSTQTDIYTPTTVNGNISVNGNINSLSSSLLLNSLGDGVSKIGLIDSFNSQDILTYDESTSIATMLPSKGTIEIGSDIKNVDNVLRMISSDTNRNYIEMITAGQGSSEIFFGQTQYVGSGILYNGNDTPNNIGNADDTVFYRVNSGTKLSMFRWHNTEDYVTFDNVPSVQTSTTTRVAVSLADHTHPASELGTLGGLTSADFIRSTAESTATSAVSIGNTGRGQGITSSMPTLQSVFQGNSTIHNNEAYLNASWIYTNAIEASNERGTNSTGIAIGLDGTFNSTNTNITLYTNGTERLRLDEAGNINLTGILNTNDKLNVNSGMIANSNVTFNSSYLATDASGMGFVSILDALTLEEVLTYRESTTTIELAKNAGTIEVGSTVKAQDNIIRMKTDNTHKNIIEMTTSGQGSSELFLGQSIDFGSGILYNGNDTPDDLKTADWTVFYKSTNSIKTPLFGWHNNHSYVSFEQTPVVNGIKFSLEGHTHDFGSTIDAATFGGELPSFYLSTISTAYDSDRLGGKLAAEYLLSSGTIQNSLNLAGIPAADYALDSEVAGIYLKITDAEDQMGPLNDGVNPAGYLKYSKNVYDNTNPASPILTSVSTQTVNTKIIINDPTVSPMTNLDEPSLYIMHTCICW